jgi:hypothetical protein
MGATTGNVNAVANGTRISGGVRNGIVLAALAEKHASIAVDLRRLKRTLDPYVRQRHGVERLKAVAMVNELCRWEMSSRVMQKTLATETLSPELTLSYLNSIGQATSRRNSLLTKLLNGSDGTAAADPWLALDAPQSTNGVPDEPEAEPPADNATENGGSEQ